MIKIDTIKAEHTLPIYFQSEENLLPVVDFIRTSPTDIKFFIDQEVAEEVVFGELISYIELEGMENASIPGKGYRVESNKLVII